MKPIFSILTVVIVVAVGAGAWFTWQQKPRPTANPTAILNAAANFRQTRAAKGLPAASYVSLSTLTNQGFLTAADCGPFAGLDATISLTADETRPQDILMSVRYPDGTASVTLCDGSVQSVTAARAAALPH